ncbi:MAG: flagellar motor protein [Clostridia bacterium]|nr:flagellar motor protein [Clostridia bacterium]
MDKASVLGLIIAFGGMIIGIIEEGGTPGQFIGISAIFIIFGGTIGATMVCFNLEDIKKFNKLLKIAFTKTVFDINDVINKLTGYAEKARREGLLSLEAELTNINDDFLKQGLQLVVDGTDPALVRDILETQIAFKEQRHKVGAAIFETAGGFAPTMGIIGTVMGLIIVLSNLSEPDKLGSKIALAFIATLYGVGSANLFWLPVANKLKLKNKQETLMMQIILEGILSLQAGDNPSIVNEKLKAFLSPDMRQNPKVGSGEV